jgi:hypothetical protein
MCVPYGTEVGIGPDLERACHTLSFLSILRHTGALQKLILLSDSMFANGSLDSGVLNGIYGDSVRSDVGNTDRAV